MIVRPQCAERHSLSSHIILCRPLLMTPRHCLRILLWIRVDKDTAEGTHGGSVSPTSSSSPSPISVNSASLVRPSLHSQQGYGSNSHDAHVHSFAHAHERGGPHFNTAPPPPVMSPTGGLMNPVSSIVLIPFRHRGRTDARTLSSLARRDFTM